MARENFGSGVTAVLALAGSAIGLGNIWRFPYIVGQYGGAAFIIVYIAACLFISIPIFLSESIIGHSTHMGARSALKSLAPGSRWPMVGVLVVFSTYILTSYYSVVGGWSVSYLVRSASSGFSGLDAAQASALFGDFISSPWKPLIYLTVFLGASTLIVAAGVKSGIEKFNKFTIPALFVLTVVIMVYSLSLPGAAEGVKYMVKPDFSKLTPQAYASALGQSFYSLSLGVGTVLIYSSYMRKKENILFAAGATAGFDLMYALMAGFAIMPAVFAAGIEPGSGPGLIFETLPYIFSKMSASFPVFSVIAAVVFFVTIFFAALSSAISLIEVVVSYLVEDRNMPRRKATLLTFCAMLLLGVLCSMSFGPLSGLLIAKQNIFGAMDILCSNYLMMAGGFLFSVFVGWKMDCDKVRAEFTGDGAFKFNCAVFDVFYFLIKWVAPVAIAVIFVTNFIQ